MKKFLIIFLVFSFLLGEAYGKNYSSGSRKSSSYSKTSYTKSNYSKSSGKSSSYSKGSSSGSHTNATKVGTSRKSVRSYSKENYKSKRTTSKTTTTSTTPKNPSKYYGKSFAKPKTISTSSKYRRRVNVVYTRPIYYVNPYILPHHDYREMTPAVQDTNAFPGFGNGKSGGAGASRSSFGETNTNTTSSKDSLDIMDIKPVNYLSDFSNVISDQEERKINSIIRRYKKLTGVEIAVVTIPTLGEEVDIDDFSQILFDKWGIGEEGINNGVLLLITTEDEMLRLQPGYGLEELLTDADSRRIEDNQIVPALADEKWEEAINNGVNAIKTQFGNGTIEATKQAYEAKKAKERAEFKAKVIATLKWLALVGIGIAIIAYVKGRNKKRQIY